MLPRYTKRQKIILIGVFLLMGVVRLSILLIPFRYLKSLIGKSSCESSFTVVDADIIKAKHIGWAVEKMSNHTPWESKCLVQAMSAQIMLNLLKIPNTLYLGIAKDTKSKLSAHAWLRCGDEIITGEDAREGFKIINKFSNR